MQREGTEGVVTATSNAKDVELVAQELARQLIHPHLGFVLFFCSAEYDLQGLGEALEQYFGGISLIGCTTAGEITPLGYGRGCISAVGFDHRSFSIASGLIDEMDRFNLIDAQQLVERLIKDCRTNELASIKGHSFALTLLDGLSSREEVVLGALSAAFGSIPHFGGSAGDDNHLTHTHVYYGGQFHTGAAVVVLFNTWLDFEVFSTHHIQPCADKLVVTRADSASRRVYELNAAPWQLGARNYLALADGHLLLSWWEAGFAVLAESGAGAGQPLAQAYSRFRQLAADAEYFYLIAGAVDGLSAVLAIDRRSQRCQVLAGGERLLPVAQVSRPQALRFATSDGETCHGFFYPPHNPACRGPVASKPPLLVFVHGGPTSACYPTFDPRIQFWTQRGFAVADLNYRGSSNFGRAYRLRLQGAWGEVEVADAEALIGHLSEQGWIDPARAFIRGASAGGFTTLCALAFGRMFAGGASLYGVSDPLSLRRSTHKFEGDYLDWLLGDPQQHAERYLARTPLLHSERIVAPLIFFQGGLDAVVLPAQTERMVAALRSRGVAVEYHCYADERHGFRQAAHLAHALEAELGFYRSLLSN